MWEAIAKFQINGLMTCLKPGCGGDLWLLGTPRVGVCSECGASYVEDLDMKLLVVDGDAEIERALREEERIKRKLKGMLLSRIDSLSS